MKRIVIFASGSGTNAEAIMQHMAGRSDRSVELIVCNKPNAGVLDRAERFNVPTLLIDRTSFFETEATLDRLREINPDLIVLAGFLWKIPANLVQAFPNQIINIHPALLPKYGGKGMYGHYVHESVIANRESESGITIHFVNEIYDDGKTIFQASCPVTAEDTPDSLARKIHQLEHKHFPAVIDNLLG